MKIRYSVMFLALATGSCGGDGLDPARQDPTASDRSPTVTSPRRRDPSTPATGEPEVGSVVPELERYLPLAEGRSWTYQVTESGVVTQKVQTVGPEEPVGGSGPNSERRAFRTVTSKDDGSDETVSWQTHESGTAIRYRERALSAGQLALEEHWAPHKLRLDESAERLLPGVTWLEAYEETKLPVGMIPTTGVRSDEWTVLAVDERVTVPAGTFDCLVVHKASDSSSKTYWFARGVGKVKEEGGQTEELVSYDRGL
jgi:hypothetical protein